MRMFLRSALTAILSLSVFSALSQSTAPPPVHQSQIAIDSQSHLISLSRNEHEDVRDTSPTAFTLAKWAPNAGCAWTFPIVASGHWAAMDLHVDEQDAIYLTGYFKGNLSFGDNHLFSAGGYDIAVAKFSAWGDLLWLNQAGGIGDDYSTRLRIAKNGEIWVQGLFEGLAFFGQTSVSSKLSQAVFLARYDSDGTLQGIYSGDLPQASASKVDPSTSQLGYDGRFQPGSLEPEVLDQFLDHDAIQPWQLPHDFIWNPSSDGHERPIYVTEEILPYDEPIDMPPDPPTPPAPSTTTTTGTSA